MRNSFNGLSGFVWWIGQIPVGSNARSDPLVQGRCQVRIFGWHTLDKSALPDSDLPWAHPILPINNPTVNNPDKPKEGDWVLGFFMDGESGQFPIMLGVLPGITAPTDYIVPNQNDTSNKDNSGGFTPQGNNNQTLTPEQG
jgi:hypothetical protein